MIVYNMLHVHIPYYLKFYEGNSRLRYCHLDHLCIVSNLNPKPNVISDTNKTVPFTSHFLSCSPSMELATHRNSELRDPTKI